MCPAPILTDHVKFPIRKALFWDGIVSLLMHCRKVSIHRENPNIAVGVRILSPILREIQTRLRTCGTKQSQCATRSRPFLIIWLATPFSLLQVSPLPEHPKQFLMPILGDIHTRILDRNIFKKNGILLAGTPFGKNGQVSLFSFAHR